jgi:hypothetical protein
MEKFQNQKISNSDSLPCMIRIIMPIKMRRILHLARIGGKDEGKSYLGKRGCLETLILTLAYGCIVCVVKGKAIL